MFAAALHPGEWTNIFNGFFYFVSISIGFFVLVTYSLCNMNDDFWETRKFFTPNEDKNKEKRGLLNVCWPFSKLDKNSLVHESSKIEIIKLLRDIINITDHKSQSDETV